MGWLWALLVALLGAAGTESAERTGASLSGPRPAMPWTSLAKHAPGSWSATLTSRASPAAVQPPAWHLSQAAYHGEGMPIDSVAAKRTAGVGQTDPTESPGPSGNDGQQPPSSPTTATKFLLLSVVTAPMGTPAHGASSASSSASQRLGSSVPAATPPTRGPRSPTATSRTVTAPLWLNPSGILRMQEEGPGAQGPSLAAVGQLVTGATQPHSAGSRDSAKTPGAELAPSRGAATQPVRSQVLPWQGREANGGLGGKVSLPAEPTKPWSAVGLSLPGIVLPQSLTPPRPSAGLELTKVEGTTPGNFVGPATPRKMSLGQRIMAWERQGHPLLSSARVPSRSEGPLRSTPAATSAPRPDSLPYGTGRAPNASHRVPRPTLPGVPAGLPIDTTGGTEASGPGQVARKALQTSTAPLPIPSPGPTRLPGPSKSIVTQRFSEPFSRRPHPAQSSSPGTQPPPQWRAKGGTSSNAASSSWENFVGHTDTGAQPADSRQGPQTAMPQEGFLLKAASRRDGQPAGEGMGTGGSPGSKILGKGAPSTWGGPGTTEPWTSSMWAGFATRGDSTRAGFFSSSASAVPTALGSDTVALNQLPITHQETPPTARTWGWRAGSHPDGPTTPPSVHGPGGALQTTAPSTGSPWPPVAAPDPGRAARSDPPLTGTWLFAAVPEATTPLVPATPREVPPRVQHVFVAENQPPRLKAAVLHLPWELSLAMEFSSSFGNPQSPESRALVLSIDSTVTPLFASLPGFQRLEVRSIRPGGVEVLFDALFLAEAPGLWAALNQSGLSKQLPPGLWVANSTVLWSMALERPLNLCVELFSCPAGYECVLGEDGNATCTSVCHRQYCKNQGICIHTANQVPSCRCPVGSDFWFLGVRCDYRVTHQALLGTACGLLVSLLLIGAAVSALVVRRVRMLLLEARADQSKSSYRRFCRLDDVSARYWSEPWLASVDSLDNPAFSTSEELLHWQVLEPLPRGSCPDACLATHSPCKPLQGPVARQTAGRPRSLCSWEQSCSSSGNEHTIDSGKASEVSASSWPMEPFAQWSPSPARHEPSGKPTHKGRSCPHSCCKGMELINLERSWTA